MAEQSVDNNNVSDYKGLEILLTAYLKQVTYKSDLAILLSHYILTDGLNYDCVALKSDPYLDDETEYEILDVLPIDWNRLPGSYKLTYKNEKTIKIVAGTKQNNSFVLYVLKENGDRDQISTSIPLKRYIPDEFFIVDHAHYKDLKVLQVADIMNIITRTVLGSKKFNFKANLNSVLDETNTHLQELLLSKDNELKPKLRNDLDDGSIGSLLPPRCKPKEEENVIGEFHLQDRDRYKPKDVNICKEI